MRALWQDMEDTLGGIVIESEPVMEVEKIHRLVHVLGETELALAGHALFLFKADETHALEEDCVIALLGKLQVISHYRIIDQCNLDDLRFENIMVCSKRKELEDNIKVLTTRTASAPVPAVREWSSGSGWDMKQRTQRNSNDCSIIRCHACSRLGHIAYQCPSRSCL